MPVDKRIDFGRFIVAKSGAGLEHLSVASHATSGSASWDDVATMATQILVANGGPVESLALFAHPPTIGDLDLEKASNSGALLGPSVLARRSRIAYPTTGVLPHSYRRQFLRPEGWHPPQHEGRCIDGGNASAVNLNTQYARGSERFCRVDRVVTRPASFSVGHYLHSGPWSNVTLKLTAIQVRSKV